MDVVGNIFVRVLEEKKKSDDGDEDEEEDEDEDEDEDDDDYCLSTIGLKATRSLLSLFTVQSVCILLECFLVVMIKSTNLT